MRVCRKTVTLVTSFKKWSESLIDTGISNICFRLLFGHLAVTGDRFPKIKPVTLRSPKKWAAALVSWASLFLIKKAVTAGDQYAVTGI